MNANIFLIDIYIHSVYTNTNNREEAANLAIKYYKLFDVLQRRELKKTDLLSLAGISAPTLAKLSKGETVTTEVIDKICRSLGVQPGDIMEHIEDKAEQP